MQPLDQSLAESIVTMQVCLTPVVMLCSLMCLSALLVTLWVRRSGKGREAFEEDQEVEDKKKEDINEGFVSAENFLKGWSERRIVNVWKGSKIEVEQEEANESFTLVEEDSDIEEDVEKESENSHLINPDNRTKDVVMKEAAVNESVRTKTSGTIKTFFNRFI